MMLNLKYYKLKQQFKKELSQLPYKLSIDLKIIATDKYSWLNGEYSHKDKCIYINKNILDTKSDIEIYSVLMHELTHAIQNYKIDNKEYFPYEKDKIKLLDICINGTEQIKLSAKP